MLWQSNRDPHKNASGYRPGIGLADVCKTDIHSHWLRSYAGESVFPFFGGEGVFLPLFKQNFVVWLSVIKKYFLVCLCYKILLLLLLITCFGFFVYEGRGLVAYPSTSVPQFGVSRSNRYWWGWHSTPDHQSTPMKQKHGTHNHMLIVCQNCSTAGQSELSCCVWGIMAQGALAPYDTS